MGLKENETLQITRGKKDGATWVKGVHTEAAGSLVNIEANVQPITGEELKQLPEGDRVKQPLLIISDDPTYKDDRFTRDEQDYEVVKIENWSHSALNPHYEAVALLKGA